MAPKAKSVRKTVAVVKQRRWSEEKLKVFGLVLAGDDDNFCHSLETWALKSHRTMKFFKE